MFYPIIIPRVSYNGPKIALKRKRACYNQDAAALEAYLNERVQHDSATTQTFLYRTIAMDVGLTERRVREILLNVSEAPDQLTVSKPGIES